MLQISQKTFLWAALVSLLVASAVLFTIHDRELDPARSGDWWAVRFVEPSDPASLAFEIENYSGIRTGSYSISADGRLHVRQDFSLSENVTRFDPIDIPESTTIKLTVTLGSEEKSLTR